MATYDTSLIPAPVESAIPAPSPIPAPVESAIDPAPSPIPAPAESAIPAFQRHLSLFQDNVRIFTFLSVHFVLNFIEI